MNKPSRIGPSEVLQSSLIDTVFYLCVKNNKGRGGGVGVKTEGGVLLKLSSSEKEGLLERGGLKEDLRYCYYCFFCLSDVKKSEECFHCLQHSNPKRILHFKIDLILKAKTLLIPDYGLFYKLLANAGLQSFKNLIVLYVSRAL